MTQRRANAVVAQGTAVLVAHPCPRSGAVPTTVARPRAQRGATVS